MIKSVEEDFVYALAASPEFAVDRLCFAARQSGLWRSDNAGETWRLLQLVADTPTGLPATALAFSPNFRVDHTLFAGVPGGVMCSSDGGKTWKGVALESPPPFVSALAVSPDFESDGVVLAATLEDGVFRSPDRGVTWQAWNFGLFDLNILSVAISPGFAHDKSVYCGADSGIFYSKNTGRAWRETGFASKFAPVLSMVLSPRYSRDGMLFAGTESSGLFRSDDRGQTWQCVLEAETINAILLTPMFPAKAEVLAVSDDTLWISQDGGQSWSTLKAGERLKTGFTSATAPSGFAPGKLLLFGLANGQILTM